MRCFALATFALTGLFTTSEQATAQRADVGLVVAGTGARASGLCQVPRCQAFGLRATRGSSLTITVYGPTASRFILAIGLPTRNCIRLPGLANQLMLGAPILAFRTGTIGRPNAIVVCPVGSDTARVQIPASAAAGQVHLQALTAIGSRGGPAFTQTVLLAVQ